MIPSLRRIGTALLLVGVFCVSAGTLGFVAAQCSIGASCMANLIGINTVAETYPSLDSAQVAISTKQMQTPDSITAGDMNVMLQGVGAYAILVGFILLLTLEFFEVYYLRTLLKGLRLHKVASR